MDKMLRIKSLKLSIISDKFNHTYENNIDKNSIDIEIKKGKI